ncbi:hypothetical protein Dda_4054 [Drechslerella dactyloides]|uniref:Ribonuclease H2 subunit B n=1 Tax=Drechslerella dactyloides TaxID=74499 RepID=A0AAD6NK33_DREDA|nr:hypothetical protein Dda_4054 [Drechslerella dactyloides]
MASPRVFVLPVARDDSGNGVAHSLLTFKHPNTGAPTRYLLHHPSNKEGPDAPFLYEILKIANPVHGPRSWLIAPDIPPLDVPTEVVRDEVVEGKDAPDAEADEADEPETKDDEEAKDDKDDGEDGTEESHDQKHGKSLVIKDAHLFLTTPVDPLYLLLAHLTADKTARNFLSLDDLLDGHPASATWSAISTRHPPAHKALAARLLLVCDTVSAGDETMYRINTSKLSDLLLSRVEAVAKSLPASLAKHINRKLSKPLSAQAAVGTWKRQQAPADPSDGIIDDKELEDEVLQETGDSAATATGEPQSDTQDAADAQLRREASRLNLNEEESATSTPLPPPDDAPEDLLPPPDIQHLAYLTHAVQFMQSYLSPVLYKTLTETLYTRHPLDPLERYQEELKELRAAATAAMDMSMAHTKRTIEDLEGGVSKEEAEREKKRKKKEGDAKKSVGVRKLEKVNTRGMAKMTSFFKKKD